MPITFSRVSRTYQRAFSRTWAARPSRRAITVTTRPPTTERIPPKSTGGACSRPTFTAANVEPHARMSTTIISARRRSCTGRACHPSTGLREPDRLRHHLTAERVVDRDHGVIADGVPGVGGLDVGPFLAQPGQHRELHPQTESVPAMSRQHRR